MKIYFDKGRSIKNASDEELREFIFATLIELRALAALIRRPGEKRRVDHALVTELASLTRG